jgi:hypothetical protein
MTMINVGIIRMITDDDQPDILVENLNEILKKSLRKIA